MKTQMIKTQRQRQKQQQQQQIHNWTTGTIETSICDNILKCYVRKMSSDQTVSPTYGGHIC